MESLKLSFEAVMPIFLLMLLGYILKKSGVMDPKTFSVVNSAIFKIFLPVLLFYNIYQTDISTQIDLQIVLYVIIAIVVIFIAGYFIVKKIFDQNAVRGVMLQGFFRSNFAILGIPLMNYICNGRAQGLVSIMVAIVVPVFNVLAVICFECFKDKKDGLNIKRLLKGIVTNPLIIGCAIGVIFYLSNISLPYVVNKAVSDISKIASPLSIIVLGGSFSFTGLKINKKPLTFFALIRLVVVPFVAIGVAILLGFTGDYLACILVVFSAPVAVSSFAMAHQMGGDAQLAAQGVVVTSALCILTLFGWIFGLSSIGVL